MRKVIALEHMSLDGFCAGPNGEMDWIVVDNEIFDVVAPITDKADTALYGRITYGMMEGYWPTAASQPDASKHDIEHSNWYNAVTKIVCTKTLKNDAPPNTRFIGENIPQEIERLKAQPGRNILLIGSLSVAQLLSAHGIIDEYWINVNPVVLGQGTPLFQQTDRLNLRLIESRTFKAGVTTLHYETVR